MCRTFLPILLTATLTFAGNPPAFAQNKKPKTWAENKEAILKPLTAEEKEKVAAALPVVPTAKPKKDRKLLVFYRCEGFVHAAISAGNHALSELGKKTAAFTVDVTDDYGVFTADNLTQYDAVLLNSTTHLKFPDPKQREALLDFIKSGKGIVGIHAASDSFYDWPEGAAMIGGQFSGHPWTAGGTWAFRLDEPSHVLNQAFDGKGFWLQDEIYQYKPDTFVGPDNIRIIVSLDMTKKEVSDKLNDPKLAKHNKAFPPGPRDVPVSWLREYGKGRLFYTNLGHNKQTYWAANVLRHFLDGLQYAFGDLEADATPTTKAAKTTAALAPETKP